MKTINEILIEIRKHKTCSRFHLYKLMKEMGIEPIGRRQRPQRYPDDAALRILANYGFTPDKTTEPRLVSMRALKRISAQAKKGGAQ
jgi:hypothetical protein